MFSEAQLSTGIIAFLATNAVVLWILGILTFLSIFFIFHKAGKPWWAALIPIYNCIILLEIAGKPWWWLFLFLIPIANVVLMIMAYVGFVKNFGRPGGSVLLLLFFPYIYMPYLAFSKKVQYVGDKSEAVAA